jgi:murein DD-endopeptidase MepM/ murein hydrolase activator NlpD
MNVFSVYRLSTARANSDFYPEDDPCRPFVRLTMDSGVVTSIFRLPPPLIVVFAVVIALVSAGRGNAESRWSWPLVGEIIHGFEGPATAWAAGHRGIDIQAAPGSEVRSPVPGRVTFVGPVAGRGVIVLRTLDDTDVTLEPIEPAVLLGDVVNSGDTVGFLRGGHLGTNSLHLGLRVAGEYVDPTPYLPLQPRIVVYDSWLNSYALG